MNFFRAKQGNVFCRQSLWDKNSYESCNISLDSEGEESDHEDDDDVRLDINYISGDVTHPQHTGNKDSIVVHCVGKFCEFHHYL